MSSHILKMRVDTTNYSDAIEKITQWATDKNTGHYVCVSNVHMCMECWDDSTFGSVVNNADLVVPDGKPLVWAKHALGDSNAKQVRGAYLMNKTCEQAVKKNFSVGIYGGREETIKKVAKILTEKHPGLQIDYLVSPPFRLLDEEEKQKDVEDINASGISVLFVGLGCPKQERWMADHQDKLHCVMLGIGAALDFISGDVKPAPEWMQKSGLEWLFRLMMEPRRLWKRYTKHNPRFVWYFMKQWLSHITGRTAAKKPLN